MILFPFFVLLLPVLASFLFLPAAVAAVAAEDDDDDNEENRKFRLPFFDFDPKSK